MSKIFRNDCGHVGRLTIEYVHARHNAAAINPAMKGRPMSNATATKHLTPAQRQALRTLFNDADTKELLQAIAGIVRHDVEDFETAENAADAIVSAARMIK